MTTEFSVAAQVLDIWGATAHAIETSTDQEADWLATLEGCRLLIEEKTKFDNPENLRARDAALASGKVHPTHHSLAHNNRLSGIIRKASDQLSSSALDIHHDLRILWFTGSGFDAEAQHMQFISTLYGSTNIYASTHQIKPCYFFRNSDFFRFRKTLDGAISAHILNSNVTMRFCLNPYSSNLEALRNSPYAKKFSTLIDPIAEEAVGSAYIVDTDIDRNNESAVLMYLQEKYSLERPAKMDMMMASVAMNLTA
jgi:hypothetical protein